MPGRPQRITNGHVAAVCGLVIAGVRFRVACAVAGVPTVEMRKHLPERWYGRSFFREIDDDTWRQIRVAYESGPDPVDEVAKRYRISFKRIYRHAQQAGWKPRRRRYRPRAPRTPDPLAVENMAPELRRQYRKLRAAGISRAVALAEVRP